MYSFYFYHNTDWEFPAE